MASVSATHYEIRVKGHMSPSWSEWLNGLELAHTSDGNTTLSGNITDQAELHGLLAKIRDLGLTLITVERLEH
jgi:hypothetical protein